MSLPQKRARGIVVDGRNYRWIGVYARAGKTSATCPVRLVVQQQDGRGQLLIARFRGLVSDDTGGTWVVNRYGAEITPGVVADAIRAGLAAGWQPDAFGSRPFGVDGEPFLRLPLDPTRPPNGSEDDLRHRLLAQLGAVLSQQPAPSTEGEP